MWSTTFWRVADQCFIDRQGGSWWHELDTDGRPAGTIWPGKSDLYHVLNALLLSLLPPAPAVDGQRDGPGAGAFTQIAANVYSV